MVEFKNIDLKLETLILDPNKIEALQDARKASLLTREEVLEKVQTGEAKILNPNAEVKVAVYVLPDQSHDSDLFKVQFYNAKGDLITTYPWTGAVHFNSLEMLEYRVVKIYDLQLAATNLGKIAFRKYYRLSDTVVIDTWDGMVYYDGRMRNDGHCGVVNFDGYKHEELSEESRRERDEAWLEHMEKHGDDYIDYCSNNSIIY